MSCRSVTSILVAVMCRQRIPVSISSNAHFSTSNGDADGASCAARLAAVRNAALSMVKFKNIPPLRGSIEHAELVLQFGVFRFPAGS